MQSVLIVIHLIVVLALVGVVLLQRSEGGGLGLGGGGVSGFMTGRGQTNVLTRTTAVLAALFFATSLVLSILAGQSRGPRSILDTAAPGGAPATSGAPSAPTGGGVLDELKRLQGDTGSPQAPAAPQAPTAQ
ncbi:preprotein translocase subunit SecG [Chelatococcus sp. SYSU_G07232]|uniref:Protein-export membrane protein SecG n=1 Tax=Chelatococcus albus TaxID=3047466 RepID=A0ABT7ABX0_9HYPH|nr:preprotein translocase subunit SecG [Chelatococcus sp. SYSU_G07232]MDJ1156853.1 preprotein translocase subunit SecG [Chelatococcus sp. SYSU_G07232]